METDKDILDKPTTYSGTTSSRSITKGEEMTTANYDIFQMFTGMSEEEMQFTGDEFMNCGNCFTRIPKDILIDAGELFFLSDYTCEKCNEPLGG